MNIHKNARCVGDAKNIKRNAQIRAGMFHVTPPDLCSNCGLKKNLQRHHEDYTKPLEIVWLCKQCHGKADEKRRKRILETYLKLIGKEKVNLRKNKHWQRFQRSTITSL